MDVKGSRALAKTAVKDVYQFCSSYKRGESAHEDFLLGTRATIARDFRKQHGSSTVVGGEEKANVFPYFIGVFDTVAALGHKGLTALVIALVLISPFAVSFVLSLLSYASNFPYLGRLFDALKFWPVFSAVAPLMVVGAGLIALKVYLKWALRRLPGYSFWKWLKTFHFTELKHQFYDTTLNVNVGYAKHAISIDENRKDFARVGWAPTAEKQDKRDAGGNLYFEQVWFPGLHADIGGGYEENESRLSDNALAWMLAAASIIPNGLKHDETVLRLHPDPAGPQHNEQKNSWMAFGPRKLPGPTAIMHKSVYRRFAAGPVVLFDTSGKYRPANMSEHVDFVQYYDPNIKAPKPADPAQNHGGEHRGKMG